MPFDFSKVTPQHHQPSPVDPIALFQASSVSDAAINDLWLVQGDALREWHENRAEKDVAVVLNTGAGKTLLGLLMAQSLVNETHRQVVYACSSIQLVEQTAEKAAGYGLPVTTYIRGEFSSDRLYAQAQAPCVTTYHALFNSRTRFRSDDIAAVIFDDAHTAQAILRDQFSLQISRNLFPDLYASICEVFYEYHDAVGLGTSYTSTTRGDAENLFLVPPFEIRRQLARLRQILLSAELSQHTETLFAWGYLQDHEDTCCLLISPREITLTPNNVPLSQLPYFRSDVRRIYLSATLRAPDAFVRAFGREPSYTISPSTTVGECERLVLIPSLSPEVSDDVSSAIAITQNAKTLILTPSYEMSMKWEAVTSPPDREVAAESIQAFKEDDGPENLLLVARYDGIDFPGDTCRVVVIDGLPTGTDPLERFQWERLNMQKSFRSNCSLKSCAEFRADISRNQ